MKGLEAIGNDLNLVLGFVKRMDDAYNALLEENRKLSEKLDDVASAIGCKEVNLAKKRYEDNDLLTIAETAELFGCGKGNIYRLHSIGDLKGYKPGKIVRFKYIDLITYLTGKGKALDGEQKETFEDDPVSYCLNNPR